MKTAAAEVFNRINLISSSKTPQWSLSHIVCVQYYSVENVTSGVNGAREKRSAEEYRQRIKFPFNSIQIDAKCYQVKENEV